MDDFAVVALPIDYAAACLSDVLETSSLVQVVKALVVDPVLASFATHVYDLFQAFVPFMWDSVSYFVKQVAQHEPDHLWLMFKRIEHHQLLEQDQLLAESWVLAP